MKGEEATTKGGGRMKWKDWQKLTKEQKQAYFNQYKKEWLAKHPKKD